MQVHGRCGVIIAALERPYQSLRWIDRRQPRRKQPVCAVEAAGLAYVPVYHGQDLLPVLNGLHGCWLGAHPAPVRTATASVAIEIDNFIRARLFEIM